MARTSKARNIAAAAAVVAAKNFSIAEWRNDLCSAALDFDSAGMRLLALAIAARNIVDPDVAREAFQEAFGRAFAATRKLSFEEALKAKTVQNRVSDAMAVFKAEHLPNSMPDQLQAAAKACRQANPTARRTPRAGGNGQEQAADPVAVALAMIRNGVEQLRHAVGDSAEGLELVASLADLLEETADALGEPVTIEGEAEERAA